MCQNKVPNTIEVGAAPTSCFHATEGEDMINVDVCAVNIAEWVIAVEASTVLKAVDAAAQPRQRHPTYRYQKLFGLEVDIDAATDKIASYSSVERCFDDPPSDIKFIVKNVTRASGKREKVWRQSNDPFTRYPHDIVEPVSHHALSGDIVEFLHDHAGYRFGRGGYQFFCRCAVRNGFLAFPAEYR